MILQEYPVSVSETCLIQAGLQPDDCLFFDIETTGLSWKRSHLYLLGVILLTPQGWTEKLWFCQRPGEEKEVLEIFAQLLETRKTLIHFNGNTFDLPYIMHKYTFYQISVSREDLVLTDLYRKLLPFKSMMGLEHMRQKDLEAYLGANRKDLFSGGELIELYQEYLKTADERLLEVLLLHNREDVAGLVRLLPLLELPELFEGKFQGEVQAELLDTSLLLKLSVPLTLPLNLQRDTPFCHFLCENGWVTLNIPLYQGIMKYFFSDYKNYFYLPLEDKAIHKSVGAYVDREHREKAKASNCYQKQKGTFLPQFSELYSPAFRREYKDKSSWFLFDEKKAADTVWCTDYFKHLLLQLL